MKSVDRRGPAISCRHGRSAQGPLPVVRKSARCVVAAHVLIVDRHTLFREALVAIFNAYPDYKVVGEAKTGFDAVELARQLQPNLVLTDLLLPGLSGLAVVRLIVQQMPHIKVVVVTASDRDTDILDAVQAGASGYILKTSSVDAFIQQLDHLIRGGVAMTDDVTRRLMHALTVRQGAATPDEQQLRQSLNPRDMEILNLVAQGMTNREIAQTLAMSEHTVRAHVRSLMHKLNVENRTQLAVYSTRASMGGGAEGAGAPRVAPGAQSGETP